MSNKFNYGGQAVIEGVMMRGKHYWSIAVRKADGEVTVEEGPVKSWGQRFPILTKPIIRGSIALIESLILGMRSLAFSANAYAEAEQEELTTKELVSTMIVAVLLTIGLFIVLPAFVVRFLHSSIKSNVVLNVIEGAVKISFFLLYILGISFMEDIRRVFQYHGAEHKAINCYESGQELTVDNVRKHSKIHSRCGTNFLLIVMFTSIFVFSFFGRPPFLQRILIHILIMPVVAGLSYEIIRQAGRKDCHPIFRILAIPGRALQLLTTREPDDSQIAVAIAALKSVMAKDADHLEERKIRRFPKCL